MSYAYSLPASSLTDPECALLRVRCRVQVQGAMRGLNTDMLPVHHFQSRASQCCHTYAVFSCDVCIVSVSNMDAPRGFSWMTLSSSTSMIDWIGHANQPGFILCLCVRTSSSLFSKTNSKPVSWLATTVLAVFPSRCDHVGEGLPVVTPTVSAWRPRETPLAEVGIMCQ